MKSLKSIENPWIRVNQNISFQFSNLSDGFSQFIPCKLIKLIQTVTHELESMIHKKEPIFKSNCSCAELNYWMHCMFFILLFSMSHICFWFINQKWFKRIICLWIRLQLVLLQVIAYSLRGQHNRKMGILAINSWYANIYLISFTRDSQLWQNMTSFGAIMMVWQ